MKSRDTAKKHKKKTDSLLGGIGTLFIEIPDDIFIPRIEPIEEKKYPKEFDMSRIVDYKTALKGNH